MAIEIVDYDNKNNKILREIGEPHPDAVYKEGRDAELPLETRSFMGVTYSDPIINGKRRVNTRIVGFSVAPVGDANQVILEFGFITYTSDQDIYRKFVYRFKHNEGNYSTDANSFGVPWTTLNIKAE